MSLLSKAEISYLQGKKQVSKSYEYKLKSIIRKKITNLLNNELPLLSPLFSSAINLDSLNKLLTGVNNTKHDLTKNSKNQCIKSDKIIDNLTEFSNKTDNLETKIGSFGYKGAFGGI